MKNVRPPQFLGNLYRDMRDRHLLIPAIALVVALLAVPVLLKSHSSSTSPTVAVDSASKADSAAVPAVVTQQLGVTQYKKRLARLSSKNPFHQQFTAVPKTGRVSVSVSPSGSSTSTSTSSTATSSTASTSSLGTSSASSSSSLPPVTGGTSPSAGSTSSTPSAAPSTTVHRPKPTVRYFAYRVAVKVGEPDKLKDRPEVKRLAMLPSSNRPLATFLGVSEDGKQAIFQISSDVDSVKGDGRCAPQPANCQYLAMKAGDKANLHYAPGNKRYNLLLTDIHAVVVGHKPSAKTSSGASGKAASSEKALKLGPG
jgi:hypothetical protein